MTVSPNETWPYYSADEIEAVAQVLASGKVNYWTGGQCHRFEEEFAAYLGVPYAVALANGTVALEAALAALGVGAGDEVIVPPRTFVATAGAVVLRSARPVFADVDPDSGNITADAIAAALSPRTKALILVHLGGWPCEMDPILELARAHDLAVIEDCAQSHGARYRGRLTGSFGNLGAFSFCQDKIISTGGEGGMVVTSSRELWLKAWSVKDHGKSWEAVHEPAESSPTDPSSLTGHGQAPPPPAFRWLHHSFGSNWRMTEMQAAIGRLQLTKLEAWVQRRRQIAQMLAEGLADLPALRIPQPPAHVAPSFYRFYTYVRPEALRNDWDRDRILAEFATRGIPALMGSCSEVYLEQAFAQKGLQPPERLPVARELGETSIAFLTHPTLRDETVARWVEVARDVVCQATR